MSEFIYILDLVALAVFAISGALLNRHPVLLEPEIYVTAAALGAVSCVVLVQFADSLPYAMPTAITLALGLRACAMLFDWRLPKHHPRNTQ